MNLLKELWMVLCLLWWCIQDDTLYEREGERDG